MVQKVYVYAGWLDDEFIGIIYIIHNNGKETISFEYSEDLLNRHSNIFLDPDLYAFSGRQYLSTEKSIFGMLSDVCPDRWGRKLIQRKEEILSIREKRSPRHLYEMDYLMSVNDFLRTDGLRFKAYPEGEFIAESDNLDIPPITELSRLEQASLNYEFSDKSHEIKWLSQLISSGSSLGGARPKANIKHSDWSLWIAKFPSRKDDIDIGAWV